MTEAPAPGSRWVSPATASFGYIVRVMGTVEGWVVARHKGAAPFLIHVNEWHKRFEPAPPVRKDEPHTDA